MAQFLYTGDEPPEPHGLTEELRDILEGYDYDEIIQIVVPIMYSCMVEREVFPLNDKYSTYIKEAKREDERELSHAVEEKLSHIHHDAYPYTIMNMLNEPNRITKTKFVYDITSPNISELVFRLLDLKNGDRFYDLGAGIGVMLSNIYNISSDENKGLTYFGSDIDNISIDMCGMILAILSKGEIAFSSYSGDATQYRPFKYNKGYVYPPMSERFFFKETRFQSVLYPNLNLAGMYYEQWVYIDSLLAGLEGDDARAVALVYGKSLLVTEQNVFLQRLLDDGWIEGIIELPSSTLLGKVNKPFLVVFSHGNRKVRSVFCDKDEFVVTSKDKKKYDGLDIEKILEVYKNVNGTCSRLIDNKDLKDKLNWHPSSMPFALDNQNNKDYIPIEEVAQIQTGTVATTICFDLSNEPTGYKILTASDIDDNGIIWNQLKSVKMKDNGYDKFALHRGDVVVTTKTTKIKVAVVDHEPDELLILTGGMLRARPDQTRLNPTYLKMFLDSEEGKELLTSISGGRGILHIGPSMFMSIKIPVIGIEKQNKKVNMYLDKVSSINAHKEIIKNLEDEISILINDKEG